MSARAWVHVGAASQQEMLDLEKLHAAAAEKAEAEGRWLDAAKEWDLAAALASKYGVAAGYVEREKAYQRFAEYRRREEAAKVKATAGAPPPGAIANSSLGTAVIVGAGGALLYFLSPGLALGALAAVWTGAKRAGSYVTAKAKGAVT